MHLKDCPWQWLNNTYYRERERLLFKKTEKRLNWNGWSEGPIGMRAMKTSPPAIVSVRKGLMDLNWTETKSGHKVGLKSRVEISPVGRRSWKIPGANLLNFRCLMTVSINTVECFIEFSKNDVIYFLRICVSWWRNRWHKNWYVFRNTFSIFEWILIVNWASVVLTVFLIQIHEVVVGKNENHHRQGELFIRIPRLRWLETCFHYVCSSPFRNERRSDVCENQNHVPYEFIGRSVILRCSV